MTTPLTFAGFTARLRDFILNCGSKNPPNALNSNVATPHPNEFNELALTLFRLQFQQNAAYRQLCEATGIAPEKILTWREIPAVPTSAFKEFELTSLAPDEQTVTFLSSGTTKQRRSHHFHSGESLAIYEASALPWFERHLLADGDNLVEEQLLDPLGKLPFISLTPPPSAAPNSSLAHMFETLRREFGSRDSLFTGRVEPNDAWAIDMDAALFAIRKPMCANRPLVLLGTAFNFVHLLDHFARNNIRCKLAPGSRVLETGGYKGQSREVPKAELHGLITKHLGIAPQNIVTEYGMSELSSQAYDAVAGISGSGPATTGARVFHFPPWARVQVVSPENGGEVAEGETGLIRVFDLANVRSVMAIQTEDLAVRRGDGFELVGRAEQAEPRGCSLMSAEVETQRR